MVNFNLSDLEIRVMLALVEAIKKPTSKERFKKQLKFLSVKSRTEKTFGYYADFRLEKNSELELLKLDHDFNETPPCVIGNHPDVEGCIFFLVYAKDGFIEFLEASATDHWPLNEEAIVVEPEE